MPLEPATTHPETAWLALATAPALAAAIVLLAAGLLRGRLRLALALARPRPPADRAAIDPALLWEPPVIGPGQLAAAALGAALVIAVGLSLAGASFVGLILAAPATLLASRLGYVIAERRYIARIERDLTAAVGRLAALLQGGLGLRAALERCLADMAPGPLRAEWAYLLERQGAPLAAGMIATPAQVFAALAEQSPSRRHATLLDHLGAAAGQPQEVIAQRCAAAFEGLQRSERRREEAATALAQMRYSGIAVGMAGLVMALYLVWSQWERVVAAYSAPLGLLVGPVVVAALLLPLAGGWLLGQVEDVEY